MRIYICTAIVGHRNVQEINWGEKSYDQTTQNNKNGALLSSSTCCDSVVESERVCERIGRKIDMVCQVDKSCLHKQEEVATTQPAQNSWAY